MLIISNPQRAIQRFDGLVSGEDSPADVVIFGSAGLGRVAVEAFHYFTQGDYASFPSIILLKPDLKRLMAEVAMNENKMALALPLKFKQLRAALRKLLSPKQAEA